MTDAVPRHQASLFDSARGYWRLSRLSGAVQRTRLCLSPRFALPHLLSALREGAKKGVGEEDTERSLHLSEWLYDGSVV